jgi:hypothetical protein
MDRRLKWFFSFFIRRTSQNDFSSNCTSVAKRDVFFRKNNATSTKSFLTTRNWKEKHDELKACSDIRRYSELHTYGSSGRNKNTNSEKYFLEKMTTLKTKEMAEF